MNKLIKVYPEGPLLCPVWDLRTNWTSVYLSDFKLKLKCYCCLYNFLKTLKGSFAKVLYNKIEQENNWHVSLANTNNCIRYTTVTFVILKTF